MLGIFYTLGIAAASLVSGTKCLFQDSMGKARGIERYKNGDNPTETYFDRKGRQRDLHTGKVAWVARDYDSLSDDEWLCVGSGSNKTRNLSEEKRRREFELGKQGDWLGRTADIYNRRYWSQSYSNKDKVIIVGAYYKDLNDGRLYVCRKFHQMFQVKIGPNIVSSSIRDVYKSCKFYMDIITGELVRKSDTQIEEEKENADYKMRDFTDEEAADFIKEFNEQQRNGGWYQKNEEKTNDPIKAQQFFYCNKFNETDHIYSLYQDHNK